MILSRQRYLLIAVMILLLAAGARLAGLSHVPPGLHYDEAANGILAQDIAYRGERPIFIGAYTGKEVLWFYAAALMVRAIGARTFTLRLTSVFFGLLSVAVGGWMVRQLYARDRRRDALALLVMALWGVSFWHGVLSRLAFRAITEPLLQALSLGLLWRAFHARRHAWRWFAAAGIATGLTAYTYLAARLFPIPVALALVVFLLAPVGTRHVSPSVKQLKRFALQIARNAVSLRKAARLRNLLLFGLAALMVFAPLGVYFLRHPGAFSVRLQQIAPNDTAGALEGWRLALGMFFVRGDPYWRFNLAGRPIFGPLLGAAMLLGVGVALVELFRKRTAPERARGLLLLVWLPVMLAPVALSGPEGAPSHLRAVGLLPLVMLFPALGIDFLVRRVPGKWSPAAWGLVGAALLLSGVWTIKLTLTDWGGSPRLYDENEGYLTSLADFLNQAELPSENITIATYHYRHPVLGFLLENYGEVGSLYGGDALVLGPDGTSVVVYSRAVPPPEEWWAGLAPFLLAAPQGPDGLPDFTAYSVDSWPVPLTDASDDFANIIALEGYALYPARAGEEMSLDLAWRVLAAPDQPDYVVVVSVCDAWGWCWAPRGTADTAANNDSYPSQEWQPGERILTRVRFDLPVGLPPGDYTARVSVYSQTTDTWLPVLDVGGAYAGTFARLGPIAVEAGSPGADPAELLIQHRTDEVPAPGLRLLGYDRTVERIRPGEQLLLALYWQAEGRIDHDATIGLLLDDGTLVYEGGPVHGSCPTSQWSPGEIVVDRYNPRLPPDLSPGTRHILLSIDGGPTVDLGELTVEATERRFEPPDDMTPLEIAPIFGGQIALLGYVAPVTALSPGETLPLTLVWRAEREIDASYTVFVHLVAHDGSIAAQQDNAPQANTYPTDLWVPGEVVIDDYALALPADTPAGDYALRVGFYIRETGQRLAVAGYGDNAVLPVTVTVR
jgi:hypothetical protein